MVLSHAQIQQWTAVGATEHMRTVLAAKFTNAQLRHTLLATAPAPIEERAPWDNFWGTGAAHAGGQGHNMLGRLLVELRDNLLQGGQQQAP